jgi:hypothetical protein
MYNHEEWINWEQEQMEKVCQRWEPSKQRCPFDPAKERLRKRRRNLKWSGSYSESYNSKWMWRKHIGMKYRLIDEESYHPPKKEYHTRGWLTW